jgi:tetratricopeptide (TPR) repeat protein
LLTKEFFLNEEFEITGYWWLPENPDYKIAGTVFYSKGKIHLELVGSFETILTINDPTDLDILLGFSNKGQLLTLHKCYLQNFNFPSNGFSTSTYRILYLFIGTHFQNSLNIKFTSISSSVFYLDEWLGKSGFQPINFDEIINSKIITVKHTVPQNITLTLDDNSKIIFDFTVNYDVIPKNFQKMSIEQNAVVIMKFETEKDISACHSFFYFLRSFLSLAVLEPVFPLYLKGKINKNEKNNGVQKNQDEVLIYYGYSDIPDNPKTITQDRMLFSFNDVSDNLEFYLKNWFKKVEILEPVYNLYFGLIYSARINTNQEFLWLIHGLESYHRLMIGGTEIGISESKKRINEILNLSPESYKNWLSEKLQFSNELTLKSRLTALVEQFPFVLDDPTEEKKAFVKIIRDTRNYLTHYDENLKPRSASEQEKFILSKKMMLLLESCLLKELGFSEEKLKILIPRSKQNKAITENIKRIVNELIMKGKSLEAVKEHIEAIKCYNNVLRLDKKNTDALINKGVSFQALDKLNESIDCYDKTLQIDPKNVLALYNKANAFKELKKINDALKIYDDVLQINPTFIKALINKGIILGELEKYDDAIRCFDESLKIEPNYVNAFVNKGVVLTKKREFELAIENYKKALMINSNSVLALFNMGITHHIFTGKLILAIICYNAALEIQPNNIQILLNKGSVLAEYGNEEKALETYEQILKIEPKNPNVLARKGGIFLNRGKTKEGLDLINEAIVIEPDNSIALMNQGIHCSNSGFPQKAIDEYYDKIIQTHPDDVYVLYNKACALSLLNKEVDAIELLKRVFKLQSTFKNIAKNDKDFEKIKNTNNFKKLFEEE